MFSFKSILFSITTYLLIPSAVLANTTNTNNTAHIYLEAILEVMHQCYVVEHKVDVQLARCMTGIFNKMSNPEHYKAYLQGDVPGDVSLVLYNQTGYTIICSLSAQKSIVVKECNSYQSAPLTKGQELSITPPQIR